jgi:carnitine-CoA ligase
MLTRGLRLNGHELEVATVPDLLRRRREHGARPLAIVEGDSLSYAQADERANRVANALIGLGVAKGDVVMTYMYNSVEHLAAWFGAAKAGAVWAPANLALVSLDLEYTIADAAPKVLITDAELLPNVLAIRDRLDPSLRIVVHGAHAGPSDLLPLGRLLEGAPDDPNVPVAPADPAGIVYTGGSTGLPKGVVISNLWFFPAALRYDEMFGVREDDVHLGLGQLCHAIGSAVDVVCPMYWGLTTVMSRWFSASRFWDVAAEHRTTIVGVFIGPLMMALLNQPSRDDDAVNPIRIASSGSGQVPRDRVEAFKERFGIELLEIYGQTETGPLGAVGQRSHDNPYHSLGRPHGWCEIAVLGRDDEPCAPGVQGEIALRPTFPHTFLLGYHRKPEQFVEACRGLWFHSGDLGHLDEQGYLHFGGRLSHSIRRRGENVAALEVEGTLLLHDAVAEAAVVGVESELGEEDVKAFVVPVPGHDVEPAELVRFCADRIAFFKVPRYVEVVETLPRSATKNEIERFRLKARGIGDAWDREAAGVTVGRRA